MRKTYCNQRNNDNRYEATIFIYKGVINLADDMKMCGGEKNMINVCTMILKTGSQCASGTPLYNL